MDKEQSVSDVSNKEQPATDVPDKKQAIVDTSRTALATQIMGNLETLKTDIAGLKADTEIQDESVCTDIIETFAAWAIASAMTYIKQHKGGIDINDNELAKTLGDEYEKWKYKEKLTMER